MQKQNRAPFSIVAGALILSILIVAGSLWYRGKIDAAHKKFIQETYQTTGGAICPKHEFWVQWETPRRNTWRLSQEKLNRKAADYEGNGCYYLK